MAAITPKVVLNEARGIPFNMLCLSQANVRRIKAGVSVDELAQDIARRGLLTSLNVRAILDEAGAETGRYEVPAGGRRFLALELLVKGKRLAKTVPVPCVVQAGHGTAAEEDSLAENVQRAALHPLDQFRAFRTLRGERGMSDEDIAAAFFVSPQVVRQRLRLASVSPALLDLYAEDGISLEQLMAFTITADHSRQEQVWDAVQRGYNKEPFLIRRMLTEGKVSGAERRAVFVGAEAYEAAGGTIVRDLFQHDAGGWFEDVALLERLVDEKLQAEAGEVIAEGWKWVEVARDFPYGHTHGMRRLAAVIAPLPAEEQARLDALRAEQDRIEAEHAESGEDLPDEVDRRLGAIETEMEALENRTGSYDPDGLARAGAFVSLSHDGRVRIERGYVRPEDEPRAQASESGAAATTDAESDGGARGAVVTIRGGSAEDPSPAAREEEEDTGRPLSERLVTELSAHRTLALREALAGDPDVALTAVLHALALRTFYGQQVYDPGSCLEIEAKSASLSGVGAGLNDTASARALARRHEDWATQLPQNPDALWDWLLDCDADTRSGLLAYCAARSLNAVHQTWDRRPSAMAHAARLAEAVSLDMAAEWSATQENYLGRVTKSRILDAVREAKGEQAAHLIDHLKKGDMAEEAERLLAGTGWLPVMLRTPALDRDGDPQGASEAEPVAGADAALPAFLDGDQDTAGGDTLDETGAAYGVAAE